MLFYVCHRCNPVLSITGQYRKGTFLWCSLHLKLHMDSRKDVAVQLHINESQRDACMRMTVSCCGWQRATGLWGRLTAEGDKAALKQQRDASIQRAHAKMEAARQARLQRKQQEER